MTKGTFITLVFRQLFDAPSSTYTYLLGSDGEAVLIDPVFENAPRDVALLRELDLRLVATLDTHVHADHVTGAWLMKQRCGSRILLSEAAGADNVDRPLRHGDGALRARPALSPLLAVFRVVLDVEEQVLLAADVVVEPGLRQAGGLRDVLDGGPLVPLLADETGRGLEDRPMPVARFAGPGRGRVGRWGTGQDLAPFEGTNRRRVLAARAGLSRFGG